MNFTYDRSKDSRAISQLLFTWWISLPKGIWLGKAATNVISGPCIVLRETAVVGTKLGMGVSLDAVAKLAIGVKRAAGASPFEGAKCVIWSSPVTVALLSRLPPASRYGMTPGDKF